MRRFRIVVAVCLLLAGIHASGQIKDKDLKVYLDGVTERGRALYEYDQAAWHGSDTFLALHPDHNGLTNYVCSKTASGWVVSFGGWNTARDKLLIVYEALETDKKGQFEARPIDPPREATEDVTAKERALELASANYPRANRPYNSAVLPAPGGNLYVYLYPAQVKDTIWPIGGDMRFTISADGKQIIETRQLHKTILDMEFKPDLHPVGGVHSHVLSDVPEDTDVFYVLNRRPSMPEYIAAGKRIFIVGTDGTISVTKR
jgi:hypothetical protein